MPFKRNTASNQKFPMFKPSRDKRLAEQEYIEVPVDENGLKYNILNRKDLYFKRYVYEQKTGKEWPGNGLNLSPSEEKFLRLTMAERIILKFDGPQNLAKALRKHDNETGQKWNNSTVYRWLWPKGKHDGTGGIIPLKYHSLIKRVARIEGVLLEESDFISFPR